MEKEGEHQIHIEKNRSFFEYLISNEIINDDNAKNCLSGLEKGEILKSIKYYVKKGNIKYQATVDGYISALTVFFDFIQKKYGWDNVRFSQSAENRLLKEAYANVLKELKLKDKETAQPLSDDEYISLVKLCNEKIDNASDSELVKKGYNSIYSYYISALITKLVLFSGIKNNAIFNLELGSYDDELNKINLNGFNVHLPDDLARQMRRYKRIRETILELDEKDSEILFINLNRNNRKLDNAKMFKIIKDVTVTNKAVSVAKYSILQLIEYGIPENIIRQFTGYSDEVYGHCQEMMDEIRGGDSFIEYNRRLDAGLRAVGIFDEDKIKQ